MDRAGSELLTLTQTCILVVVKTSAQTLSSLCELYYNLVKCKCFETPHNLYNPNTVCLSLCPLKNCQYHMTDQITYRKCLFVATVATDSAVSVATLPFECQSLTVNHFSFT